jgi:Flp pilus assembly protein protease CpaA
MNFLFWLYFFGVIIACFQDLKRREVDNWLNLFLGASGLVYILYRAIFEGSLNLVVYSAASFAIMFVAMNVFYYGKVFAGGDAKLLFAMSPLFVELGMAALLRNVGVFLVLLMFSGSIYGLFYSGIVYSKHRKESNREMKRLYHKVWFLKPLLLVGLLFSIGGGVSYLFNFNLWLMPVLAGALIFLFPILYLFSKSLEKVTMIREVSGWGLREGDWLVHDVRVKGKIIKSSWDGLSKEDLALLRDKKKVKIKEGLPFVPAFLIALILYNSLRGLILSIFS